ncbi:MAG TPA: bifunctional nuclease family protein [Acidimicrobiales bacterium]|nr:bifunctional nuclease family protein [Acidimicrobiales bacterium]
MTDTGTAGATGEQPGVPEPDVTGTDARGAVVPGAGAAGPATDAVPPGPDDAPKPDPAVWHLVAVHDIVFDLPAAYPEVVLHEAQHPWRELRIPLGVAEATAIAYAFRSIETPRPMTHDLFTEVLERYGITIDAVRITVRRGQAFLAEMDTSGPRGRQVMPCRPSDAVALALRQRLPVPILVAEWVFASVESPGEDA